ncbi:MAG: DNA polymerase III, beta subunit [uncultured bacterium (gcode 4)]|uniref:Beta sliding clamp n=1 Tax=uncultured bacterium (gcode 4) TaxID=1234023 RepID=K2GZ44_9BACT|nr:MAG: DNA polymerase III, beta subunit [uncultured bacterium (gcode 4)]
MHFEIATKTLKNGIDIVSHASMSWSMTPILENILMNVQYKKVVFTANNLEMAIEYIVDEWVEIQSEWSFTISSKFITSFVSLVQDDKINIELLQSSSLAFKTPSSDTKIKWIEASKFPLIPNLKQEYSFRMSSDSLKKAIEKTIFSTAEWTIRPTLAWIYLHITDEEIIFASTDSYRLSEYKVKNSINVTKPISIIIPQKTAHELSRILPENTSVELVVSENQILFVFENIRLYSRLLNGHFPDYRSFFPKGYQTKWVVLRTDLIMALKRINLISKENNFNTRMNFDSDHGIELSTWDTEIWAWRIELPASIEWENAMIWLNSTYMLEVLWVIKDDYVSIDFETSLSPVMIRWITEKEHDFDYKHIIMPLKI